MRRLIEWLERALLIGFDDDEADEVLADVRELSAGRGRLAGYAYRWAELVKYPLRRAWDGIGRDPSGTGTRGGGGMDALWKDARYAVRSLRRDPGFSAMAVTIMTLAMGATAAIFTVVDAVLLEPLPVEEPDRLAAVWLLDEDGSRGRMTPGNFTDLPELDVLSSVAAFRGETASLALGDEVAFLRGGAVTPAYFETLGVRLVAGRGFLPEEGEAGGPLVVVLSQGVWERAFGADPGIVGRFVVLDETEFRVVGVAPPGIYPTTATVSAEIPFTAANQDFFVPLRFGSEGWANRRSHLLGTIARMGPDATLGATAAAAATLSDRLHAAGLLNPTESFLVVPFEREVVGDVSFALVTLLATVALVLLIAVVNVGSLFVLRADDRSGEVAIRSALGAPAWRLRRQRLIESGLIATIAAIASTLVASWGLRVMRGLVPYQIPRLADATLATPTLVLTSAVGLAVAVALGMAPSLRADSGAVASAGARGRTAGPGRRRLQGGVVSVQAGLAVLVLVGAALLTRSYAALRAVDTGFTARDTWAMSLPTDQATMEEVVRRVRELPEVASAAMAYDHPLSRSWGDGFVVEGVELSEADDRPSGSLRPFGLDYFRTAGVAVVEGRVPDATDMAGPVAYAVVNETLRDRYLAGQEAIGARIRLPTAERMFGQGVFEVVGVVRDVRFLGPDQAPSPALYVPLSHFPAGASVLLVRPDRPEADVLGGVRAVVRAVAPGVAPQQARRLGDILDDLLARPRFNMTILSAFGLMGLVLCGLGAYGLLAKVVVARFREIGVRMALGADRLGLAGSVLASALRPLVLGGLVGLGAAAVLGRFVRAMLFEISPLDPLSFAASSAMVLLVGIVAAVVPAARAVSVDPARTLRNE